MVDLLTMQHFTRIVYVLSFNYCFETVLLSYHIINEYKYIKICILFFKPDPYLDLSAIY